MALQEDLDLQFPFDLQHWFDVRDELRGHAVLARRQAEFSGRLKALYLLWGLSAAAIVVWMHNIFPYENFPGTDSPDYNWWLDHRDLVFSALGIGALSVPLHLWAYKLRREISWAEGKRESAATRIVEKFNAAVSDVRTLRAEALKLRAEVRRERPD